jgi:hypothetical protein
LRALEWVRDRGCVIANPDAVSDRPIRASREQDVDARKFVAYQELPAIRERDLDVAQLFAKIFASFCDQFGRNPINWAERVGPVAAHHVEACGIQLRDDEEAPLQPDGIFARRFRNQRAFGRRIRSREVSDDRGTFADAKVAVLQQGTC